MLKIEAAAALALALMAPAAEGQDPIAADPPVVDPRYPPALLETSFESHGAQLNAIIYLAQGEGPHPTVLLLHGFPGNEKNLDLAQALRRSGINVFFFHYRGSWGSQGDYSVTHALEDVSTALDHLREPAFAAEARVDPARIAIVGHSLGGFLTLQTLAGEAPVVCAVGIAAANLGRLGKMARSNPAAAEALVQAFESGTGPLRGTSGRALVDEIVAHADDWDLVDRAAALSARPLLLVGGYRDRVVPMADYHEPLMEVLRAAGGGRVTELILDDDHAFSRHRIALARAVVEWLGGSRGF